MNKNETPKAMSLRISKVEAMAESMLSELDSIKAMLDTVSAVVNSKATPKEVTVQRVAKKATTPKKGDK